LAERATLAERVGLGRREVRGAFRGTRDKAEAGTHVVVVGGGIAGASAACVLAERGVEVTLIEAQDSLGGRLASLTERLPDGHTFQMARGFPAIHRHYYNVRALLRRVDSDLESVESLGDYPVLGPGGSSESFANLPTTSPLNLLALARRSRFLRLSDLRKIDGTTLRTMLEFDAARSYGELDSQSAKEWLDRLVLPKRARQMLFRVFARSFFNSEDSISAAEMLASLHFYFLGNPEGLAFEVLGEPASDVLFVPLERYLRKLGATVLTRKSVRSIEYARSGPSQVHLSSGEAMQADGVVLATAIPSLKTIIEASPGLCADAAFAQQVSALGTSPRYAVLRLYLDAKANESRAAFVSTTGMGSLDSITLFERFEGESRRWSKRHGGSVVQLQAVDLDPAISDEGHVQDLVEKLRELYPELDAARVLHHVFLSGDDQPSFAPGSYERRPRIATPYGSVVLAGDYVRLPFPSALMERACASGFLAANLLLDRWDVRGETVWSIPPRGFMAGMRFRSGER
jgi:carotenoid phi-ring synthase / carotenoid chi-ring synthase